MDESYGPLANGVNVPLVVGVPGQSIWVHSVQFDGAGNAVMHWAGNADSENTFALHGSQQRKPSEIDIVGGVGLGIQVDVDASYWVTVIYTMVQ